MCTLCRCREVADREGDFGNTSILICKLDLAVCHIPLCYSRRGGCAHCAERLLTEKVTLGSWCCCWSPEWGKWVPCLVTGPQAGTRGAQYHLHHYHRHGWWNNHHHHHHHHHQHHHHHLQWIDCPSLICYIYWEVGERWQSTGSYCITLLHSTNLLWHSSYDHEKVFLLNSMIMTRHPFWTAWSWKGSPHWQRAAGLPSSIHHDGLLLLLQFISTLWSWLLLLLLLLQFISTSWCWLLLLWSSCRSSTSWSLSSLLLFRSSLLLSSLWLSSHRSPQICFAWDGMEFVVLTV